MEKMQCRLTVFFEDPFWVGVYERVSNGKLEVCKITFGPEPKSYEVYEFLNRNWKELRFSPAVRADAAMEKRINPKRMQRQIQKQLSSTGVGTKSQQALQLQREEGKETRKKMSRLEREEAQRRKYEQKREKRKEKHRGR